MLQTWLKHKCVACAEWNEFRTHWNSYNSFYSRLIYWLALRQTFSHTHTRHKAQKDEFCQTLTVSDSNTKSRRWKALNHSGRNCTTTHSKHSLTTNFSSFTCSSDWKVRLTSSAQRRWKSSADWRTRRGNAKKYSRILPVSHRRWLRVLSREWHMCLNPRGASPMRGWRVLMIRVGMRRRRKFNWIGKFCRRLLLWGDDQSCQQYD